MMEQPGSCKMHWSFMVILQIKNCLTVSSGYPEGFLPPGGDLDTSLLSLSPSHLPLHSVPTTETNFQSTYIQSPSHLGFATYCLWWTVSNVFAKSRYVSRVNIFSSLLDSKQNCQGSAATDRHFNHLTTTGFYLPLRTRFFFGLLLCFFQNCFYTGCNCQRTPFFPRGLNQL